MKARLASSLPVENESEWLFELKFDGIRALAILNHGKVQLLSRRPKDITSEYAAIVHALQGLPVSEGILDGEIVALDSRGHSSFQLLQNRKRTIGGERSIFFYLFDVLNLEGWDLLHLPLLERRRLLEEAITNRTGVLRYSATLEGSADAVWREVTRLGLEGVIAKRKASFYEPGLRSGEWIKVKTHFEQEFVIGGYTQPRGSRTHFGAILVGYYQGKILKFAARVGTGFDFDTLADLYRRFEGLQTDQCPFAGSPGTAQGMTAAEWRRATWLKPNLVCQIRFQEWTRDGSLRQPVCIGLREDKKAKSVVRE